MLCATARPLLLQVDNAAFDTTYAAAQDVPMPDPGVYEDVGVSLKLSAGDIRVGATVLGRGNYGVVFKGLLAVTGDGAPAPSAIYSQGAGTEEVAVAIKTLPDDKADVQAARDDLWEEIKIMCKVQSKGGDPNVVRFHGYAGRPEDEARAEGPMLLVLEFAGNGSLHGHLKQQRTGTGTSAAAFLPPQQLRSFATDIAKGMSFVSNINMVHRDLAARNILLDAHLRCKITDFGLTRSLYMEAQYTADTGNAPSNPTAWRWTSLEGLTTECTPPRATSGRTASCSWSFATWGSARTFSSPSQRKASSSTCSMASASNLAAVGRNTCAA